MPKPSQRIKFDVLPVAVPIPEDDRVTLIMSRQEWNDLEAVVADGLHLWITRGVISPERLERTQILHKRLFAMSPDEAIERLRASIQRQYPDLAGYESSRDGLGDPMDGE
jgi:hypothetical protein